MIRLSKDNKRKVKSPTEYFGLDIKRDEDLKPGLERILHLPSLRSNRARTERQRSEMSLVLKLKLAHAYLTCIAGIYYF